MPPGALRCEAISCSGKKWQVACIITGYTICGTFSDFFLDLMRHEFRRRVDFAAAMASK